MIKTPSKKQELPQVVIDANSHIERSALLETKVSELKKMYANLENIRNANELAVVSTGVKLILTKNDEVFSGYKDTCISVIENIIQLKEQELNDILNK